MTRPSKYVCDLETYAVAPSTLSRPRSTAAREQHRRRHRGQHGSWYPPCPVGRLCCCVVMSAHRALLPLARRSLLPSFRSPSAETVGAAGSPIASCWPAHRHCLSNWRGGLSTNASSSPSAVLRPVPFSSHSLRSSSSHFGVAPSYRRRLVSTSAVAASPLASGGDGGGDDEEEDEFAEIGFEDDEEVDLTVEDTPAVSLTPAELEDAASLTPELAAEVVARMVQAATTGTDGGGGAASASSPVTTTADGGNLSTPPPLAKRQHRPAPPAARARAPPSLRRQ